MSDAVEVDAPHSGIFWITQALPDLRVQEVRSAWFANRGEQHLVRRAGFQTTTEQVSQDPLRRVW
jgi:hypothetical protein